jgi:hypothetical protein
MESSTAPRTALAPDRHPYQAFRTLQFVYVVAPILAGLDKFFDFLVNWPMYLAPVATRITGASAQAFMRTVGVIEIIAGLIVAFKPRVGAYIVGVWLLGIVLNLLLVPGFYDIALRDFGLALGAFALARLSYTFSRP